MLKNIVTYTLRWLNALFALLLLLTYLSPHVSPGAAWGLGFLALIYPHLLIINLLFIALWIYRRKWFAIISVVIIAAGYNNLTRIYQIRHTAPPENNAEHTKILSYNVRSFNRFNYAGNLTARDSIIAFIQNTAANIVCLQEYYSEKRGLNTGRILQNKLGYQHAHVHYLNPDYGYFGNGIVTFTNYPVAKHDVIKFGETNNIAIYTDVIIAGDTVRVFNCHLQSVKIQEDEKTVMDTLKIKYSEEDLMKFMRISSKLKQAFIIRAQQVDLLHNTIKQSPYPVIVCGDFNDIPNSYAYGHILGDLKDAYIESGSGTGNTYVRNLQGFRIDYIFHSNSFRSVYTCEYSSNWSDHYPLITYLQHTNKHWQTAEH